MNIYWEKKSPTERSLMMHDLAKKRWAKTSKKERREIALKLVKARNEKS